MVEKLTQYISPVDWAIIVGYLVFAVGLAAYHMKKATSGMDNYFASGRKASWWLLGTSMVATTFAADTPLAVSGWVVGNGIYMNWFWWCWVMSTMLGVYFFARLWRRSGVLTDNELAELRYRGKQAGFLRGFRAVHFGILKNCIIIGWVNMAMMKVLQYTIGLDGVHELSILGIHFAIEEKMFALMFCFVFSLGYTMLAGLTGVMATDFVQFIMAMFGSVWLAVAVVNGVGGLDQIVPGLQAAYGAEKAVQMTTMFPTQAMPMYETVLIFIFLAWWTATNTDSGEYLAQRMLSAKDEKHSFFGMLWFNISFYCIRPWPWILVGLCAAVLAPTLAPAARETIAADPETGYIFMMREYLPAGILGLAVASFFAAYMSTIDTHLNWGASYMVNDIYKRFIKRDATEKHYIKVSWLATIFIAVIGAVVSTQMNSIREAWYIISKIYAGLAVVYILRWFWWRINAWSEIAAMVSSILCLLVTSVILPQSGVEVPPFPQILYYIVPVTVGTALIVTFLTPPVEDEQLIEFYKKVRPGGPGWRRIQAMVPGAEKDPGPGVGIPGYLVSVAIVYCTLFGMGKVFLGPATTGYALLGVAAVLGVVLYFIIRSGDFGVGVKKEG